MADKSFVFYESWSKFIDKKDRETAKELVYQIYRIGTEKDFDTDNEEIIDIVEAFITENIKGAKRKYRNAVENGKKSKGAPKVTSPEQDELIWQLHQEGWTYEQIAEELNISKNTVGTRVRERREQEIKTKNKNQEINPNEKADIKTFKDKDKSNSNLDTENEEENENESIIPLHYDFNN